MKKFLHYLTIQRFKSVINKGSCKKVILQMTLQTKRRENLLVVENMQLHIYS